MTQEHALKRRVLPWFIYDHVGAMVRLNVYWLLVSCTLVGLPVATVALVESVDRLADGKPADLKSFVSALRHHAVPATLLGVLYRVAWAVIDFEMTFYGDRMAELGWWGALAWALGAWLTVLLASLAWISCGVMGRGGSGARTTAGASWKLLRNDGLWGVRNVVAGLAAGTVLALSGFGILVAAPVAVSVLVIGLRRRGGQGIVLPGGSAERSFKDAFRPWN